MVIHAIWVITFALFLTNSAQGRARRKNWARKPWTKSYVKLTRQTWFSISRGRRDGALYGSGSLRSAGSSDVPCLGASQTETDEVIENDQTNGVICKLGTRNGRKKWCVRTCEEGVSMLSVITPGKEIVYTAGETNNENTVLYGIEKKTGRQVLHVLIQGQVHKIENDHDGVYVCGKGTDKEGEAGMMIARITQAGDIKWRKVLRDGGQENCLSISVLRKGYSAYVVGIMRGGSNRKRVSVMKVDRGTGEVGWTTELGDKNYAPTSGDIIVRKGVYVTTLEADSETKRTHVVVHKLGQATGMLLWSRSGKEADGVYESGFQGKRDLAYASYNSSGVLISSMTSSSTSSLLGDAERENETWVQSQEATKLNAVDTALGIDEAVILWRTNEGGNMIQKVSFNRVREAESKTDVAITRVKTKLKMDLPVTEAETVKAGICDIVADAMRGRARIVNDFLMAGGNLKTHEAEMVIRKTMEDRDNDGRSYVETQLGLRKRSVLLEGELMTIGARKVGDHSAKRQHRAATLSGQVEAGGTKSVVAEATKPGWWTWWKILIATAGTFGVGLVVFLVVRRMRG